MDFILDTKDHILPFLKDPLSRAGVVMGLALLLAVLINKVMLPFVLVLTRKTKTDFDDKVVEALRRPLFVTVLVVGTAWSLAPFTLQPGTRFVTGGLLRTVTVLVWAVAAMRMGTLLLQAMSRHTERVALIQPRTLPLFEILVKVVVIGGAVYFAFLAWNINVTGWLASAGIVGIAVGFAAKDTLANLFAGFFILADAPYKLGDFVAVDNQLRGQVTEIGFRSTRILTRDDIEIIVPNAVIANSKIINETGGPWEKERIRVKVSVAYGSEIERVREVLLSCTQNLDGIDTDPSPRVRFRSFGGSGLEFELMAWIHQPVLRGRVLDELNTRVYNALNAAGIEIPYEKRDVYIKQMPGRS